VKGKINCSDVTGVISGSMEELQPDALPNAANDSHRSQPKQNLGCLCEKTALITQPLLLLC